MIYFNDKEIENLSFPDYEVELMSLQLHSKQLKIIVSGACLQSDTDEMIIMNRGILYFYDWESLDIRKYNSSIESWNTINLEKDQIEPLRDLCDVQFSDSVTLLQGFGKTSGQWLEWKLINAKKHAEFES